MATRVYSIMDRINDAYTKLSDSFGADMTKVAVEYDRSSNRHGNVYYPYSSTIALNGDSYDMDFTVLHEYGHHVMRSVYIDDNNGDWPQLASNPAHQIHKTHASENLVWYEGWANYIPLLVRNSPVIQHHSETYDFEDRTRRLGSTVTQFDNSSSVEGNVAAVLWDLTDGLGEPENGINQDDVSGLEGTIWDVFDSPAPSNDVAPHENFDEFVDQWRLDFPRRDINKILLLNTYIDMIPPPNPTPPAPSGSVIFRDRLDDNLSGWSNTGDDEWEIGQYRFARPPFADTPLYNVAVAEDCDDECILERTNTLDLDDYDNVNLSFYYFVDEDVDGTEGLKVEVSDDGGSTWEELFYWNEDNGGNTHTWEYVSGHNIDDYASDQFKIRFTAMTSSRSEDIQLAHVEIRGESDDDDGSQDTVPPTVTAPDDVTAEATGVLTAVSIGQATATDNRDPSPEITNDAPASFPLGATTITWTATDDAGNSATATQTVTVRDTTPPVVTAPAAYTAEATGAMTALDEDDYGTATATDLVDPDPEITSNAPASFPVGTTTITWTATDGSGNSATATQAVTVRSTAAPMITAPADYTVEATGALTPLDAGDYGTATATDLVDPDPEITSNAPASFPLGDTVVTWTATNDAGNSATATQTVTVRDTTHPVITAPAAYAAEATGAMTALDEDDYGTATATDLVDPDPEITNDAPDSFPVGATTITWTATDDAGNSATAAQTVTVRQTVQPDTTAPAVTAPGSVTAEATGVLTAVSIGRATATDDRDPDPEITSDAPASFPLGDTVVTWTATDDAGNSSTATQTVTVRDTTPPAVTAPADHTAEAAGAMTPLDAGDYGTATATDLVDPDPEITSNAPASFQLGDTTVTWAATDASGNSATDTQTVTVRDTTPPAIVPPPDIEVVAPTGGNATVYFAVPEAADLADPDVDVSCAPASGSAFQAGSTAVACTAADSSGNESSASFDVRVVAVMQDVLFFDFESGGLDGWTKSGGQRWHADGPAERIHPPGRPAHNRVAEADGCAGECIMTLSSPVDMTPYRSGELTFYRYIDDDLDASEYLRVDAFDGSVWRQLDIWTQARSDDDDAWHLERYALDDYADAEAFKIRFVARMSSAQEQVAVDDIALTATRAADAEPPAVAAPPDAAFEATAPLTPLDEDDYGAATATDGSGAPPEVTSDAPSSFPVGDTVVTWTATDASGNTATDTQTVTVRDTTPPAFTSVPGDLAVLTHHGRDAEVVFAVPEAEDVADPDVEVSCTPASGSGFGVGSTTVACTATDDSGNESRASFEVRVGQYEATATVSRTVTGEGATWTVAGPAAVFAGETYEYAVTLEDGTRPLNEALAIYSATSTVDDFGQHSDGADCEVALCAGFPGQAGRPYELDNHGGSPYDIRYRAIGAAGPGHVITLQVGDSAQAGAGVTVGLMDRHGGPRGGVQVTVADPATASTLGRQLVSHLAFEGNVRDSAGGSHGTVNGTESYVGGAVGRAFHFDGSTHVVLAGADRFALGTADPFSLSLWFKKDGPDAMRSHILTKQDTRADPGLFMWIWPGSPSRIQTGIHDGEAFAGVNTLTAVNVTDGMWRHVAVTYDGSGLRDGFTAYVDGHDRSDRRMALRLDGAGTNGAPVTLGALGSGHDRLHDAAVDELRVYSRELTASEAFELYAEGAG